MRIGCAAYSYRDYFTKGIMGLEDFIKVGYELGLDGVELTVYYFKSTEDNYVFKLKRLALEYGLDIPCVSVGNNFTEPEQAKRREQVDYVKRWLDVASKLGAPCLRIFAGKVPKGYTEDDAIKWTVECIKECIDYASKLGIILVLENHGGITSTADQVLKIINAVNSDWLALNLDVGNFIANRYENIRKVAPYALHVHAKFYKPTPFGDEEIDYTIVLRILREVGYKGYLSIEYEGKEEAKSAVPKAVSFLRKAVGIS